MTAEALSNDENELDIRPAPWRQWLMPAVSLVLFFAALWAINRLLHQLRYEDLVAELSKFTFAELGAALLFTAVSFVFLTGYDWAALTYIGRRVPYRVVALASFCGYAIANTVGLALLSGGSVRYRMYLAAGLDGAEIARVIVFTALAFGIAVHLVGAATLAFYPDTIAGFLPISALSIRLIGWIGVALLVAVIVLAFTVREPLRLGPWKLRWRARRMNVGKWRLKWRTRNFTLGPWSFLMPSGPLTLFQLFISVADIFCAGAVLYILLPGENPVPFLPFAIVYILAITAGLISHVPGGLGVFESVMLFALGGQISTETLTAAILGYRVVYYLVPLVVATVILAAQELREPDTPVASALHYLQSFSGKVMPPLAAGLSFASGAVLLIAGAIPAKSSRLPALEALVPLPLVELSHLLAALTGFALLIVARGLFRRFEVAVRAGAALCLLGVVFALARGLDYGEALALLAMASLLTLSRREFQRRGPIAELFHTQGWTIALLGAVGGMLWAVQFSFRYMEYSPAVWFSFGYEQDYPRALRAGLAVMVCLGLTILARLREPLRAIPARPGEEQLLHAGLITRTQHNAYANYVYLGDKSVLFSDDGDAFLMFRAWRSSWIALGDPVGPPQAAYELAWRFRDLAERQDATVAFYQTRTDTLSLYLDMGLTPVKIGDEAVVLLSDLDPDLPAYAGVRTLLDTGERLGLRFDYWPPHTTAAGIATLTEISEAWRTAHGLPERGFAQGTFHPDYVGRFPSAIASRKGRPLAFATVLITDTGIEAALDLLRADPLAPVETLGFLQARLLLQLQTAGYRRACLGLAPQPDLESHPLAPLWHRYGHLLFNRGLQFFSFAELRLAKARFGPIWEPRYLATHGGVAPLMVMADVADLIAADKNAA